ncbi:MAG: CHASE domain-containing protein, partial [Pseudomonadales bacterium]|nr:CHASE domain-containing protein [Pseudomonadales bacterium]
MKGYPRNFLIIFFVALAYYLGGQVGLLLAMPPSNAGIVWPSAGIALAAVMVLGRPAVTGIFIGAFATVFPLLPDNTALLLASVNGLGSAVQAIAGAWLVRRYAWRSNLSATDISITMLVLFGVPASSLISATINISAQLTVGALDGSDFLIGWLGWWMGDTIGIYVFTPLTLLALGRSRPELYQKRLLIGVPILFCFLVVMVVLYNSIGLEKKRLEAEFQHQADSLAYALKVELEYQEETLHILGSYYKSSPSVSREEFKMFVENLLSNGGYQRVLEWIPHITVEEREAFEREHQDKLYPAFQITELAGDGNSIVPAGIRNEYFPISYLEPIKGNERAIGFNILSNPLAKEAAIRARDSGMLAITSPLQLIQATPGRLNYVMYLPIYKKGSNVDRVDSRRRAFIGVLASVINFSTVATRVFDSIDDDGINIHIYENNRGVNQTTPFFEKIDGPGMNPYGLSKQFDFTIASTAVKMVVEAHKTFGIARFTGAIAPLLLGTLLFSGLVILFVLQLAVRSMRIEQIVNERTIELTNEVAERKEAEEKARLSEERFQRALKATNEGIWDWNIESAEMISIPSWEEFLGYAQGELPEHDIDMWRFLTHPDDRASEKFAERQLATELGSGLNQELRLKHKNGNWVWILSRGEVVERNDDGLPIRIIGTRADITERKKTEEETRIAATAFETHEGILITGIDGNIVRVNQAFCDISGFQEAEVIGQHPEIFDAKGDDPDLWESIGSELEQKGRWEGETTALRKSGERYPIHARITNVENEMGEVTHTVYVFSDITQRKQDEDEIAKLAFFDPLTNLPNRRMLMMTVEHEMTVARRSGRLGG